MSAAAYGTQAYWQSRYRRDAGEHDWYQDYAALAPLLPAPPAPAAAALVLGCGTSALPAALARRGGWRSVTAVDWAPAAVEAMAARHGEVGSALRWLVADACAPPPPPPPAAAAGYALVVDKACLDCVLCGEASHARAAALITEVHRALAPGGVFVCVTHAPPEARLALFDMAGAGAGVGAGASAAVAGAAASPPPRWALTVHALPKPTVGGVPSAVGGDDHYAYIAIKL